MEIGKSQNIVLIETRVSGCKYSWEDKTPILSVPNWVSMSLRF